MIRLMQAHDVADVVVIENLVQSHPWSAKQFGEAVESYHITVMEHAGKVVGFVIFKIITF